MFRFSLVDGCSHILTFIAGVKKISLSEASITDEAKASDEPVLNFEIVFAVAGATNIKSDHLESEIWSISVSFSILNKSS